MAAFLFAGSVAALITGVKLSSHPVVPERITVDLGGSLLEYLKNYSDARVQNTHFVLDGLCISACTLITGEIPNENVCSTPYAKLAFHAAFILNPMIGRVFSPEGTELLWRIYPESIRELLKKHGWAGPDVDQDKLIWIEGEELQQIFKLCPSAK